MTGFIRATKNIETLQSDDIANAILYAIQAPNHVNASEILIRSKFQTTMYSQSLAVSVYS
jgi:NADP-dependent 3-hydroxy acid dehydrogenase YdfG